MACILGKYELYECEIQYSNEIAFVYHKKTLEIRTNCLCPVAFVENVLHPEYARNTNKLPLPYSVCFENLSLF